MRNLSFKYLDVLSLFQILRCTISLSIISMRILSFKIFRKKMAQLPKNDHRCIHHNNWSCGFLNNMDENIAPKIPKGCSSFKRIMLLIICVTRILLYCTMCCLYFMFYFQLNKLRHVLKFMSQNTI